MPLLHFFDFCEDGRVIVFSADALMLFLKNYNCLFFEVSVYFDLYLPASFAN